MKWSRLLVWAGLLALVGLVFANFGYVAEFGRLIGQTNWSILGLVVITQAISYWGSAWYYQLVLRLFGYQIGLRPLYETALAVNFVNQAFPSGGIAGASYLSGRFHGEVPVGKTTLVQLLRYLFIYISFVVVLIFGFGLLLLGGDLTRLTARLTLLLLIGIIIVSLLVIMLLGDRSRTTVVLGWVARQVNRLLRLLPGRKRSITPTQLSRFSDEFYHGYDVLRQDRRAWLKPLAACLITSLAEVATVYVVFAAFGQFINPGVVIAGYALANLFSLLGFLSGGVGVYEAAMVATLAALGVPLALSLSVTIVYRALNFLLGLPLGFYFYHRGVR